MSSSSQRAVLVVDGILAALFFGVCSLYALVGGPLDLIVVALFSAALVLRRAAPGAALVVAWVAACAQMLMLRDLQPADAAVFVIVYSTSAHGSRVVRWWGLGSAGAGALLATIYLGVVVPIVDGVGPSVQGDLAGRIIWTAILFGAALAGLVLAWTIGLLTRTVRDAREQRRRAEFDRREREHAEYRYVVEQERTRIARDMHDVVAHSLAVVIAQADGARFAARSRPEAAVDALGTIAGVARGALGDVRLLLGELRHREGASPQPELDDLDDLVEQVRGAGLDVRRSDRGDRVPLGAGHQIAVYRIVQEGLTNALRHGDTSQPVELELDWDADGVGVRLENAVPPDAATNEAGSGPRHGIPGMRERAELAGGAFAAEATEDGRFRVTARIPARSAA
ncbi:signal transduction histidine kinase [Agromyces flavus]|uniref:histidine kinase n=1 Tax=Agromyces flavus TaxID=589382 RepID=A0A1H1S0U3_9MICO|nr:histidine kinase [Agromyces flavus]MCP2368929.1 signal transduction histidine kinase [Agromyces flavus]GGI48385.1 two-component sensor histidine kinase [Agromyces flavus]SDS41587.1 Signal transduction histidine kinase [Agromyces flavus]